MSDVLNQIMGVNEAGELWGYSPDHVKRMCRDGEIASKQIGKTWIIDKNQENPKILKELAKMNFTVIATKDQNFINAYGIEMSETVEEKQVGCNTMTQAENKARELYESNRYDCIIISANQSEGVAFYNYHGGVGPESKNWIEHFEAAKQFE